MSEQKDIFKIGDYVRIENHSLSDLTFRIFEIGAANDWIVLKSTVRDKRLHDYGLGEAFKEQMYVLYQSDQIAHLKHADAKMDEPCEELIWASARLELIVHGPTIWDVEDLRAINCAIAACKTLAVLWSRGDK